jgi:hypothetical protein
MSRAYKIIGFRRSRSGWAWWWRWVAAYPLALWIWGRRLRFRWYAPDEPGWPPIRVWDLALGDAQGKLGLWWEPIRDDPMHTRIRP